MWSSNPMGASMAYKAPWARWCGCLGGDLLGLFFGNLLLPALLVAPVLPPAPKRGDALEDAVVRPTLPRSTPIATTALSFIVRLDSEGASSMRLGVDAGGI